ncbi:biotin-dependent carboxyltransferase family protein [Candidatus Nephthysia bennettiae]|uniref:Biotin-dependent carboxyltransferase n=1 Tax=Candidatus Nephthysia bennettiae TaxID=3127016 RepID=A0A934K0X2_9BACT|nr:biotin-dependent carboxyltransferase [Candidatus Dormibacteraeota bacterium]MBJ7612496.1 biotin-dependent carboxyltransferase [Candidatus Dormibacteraeota bacterium]
MIGPAALPPPLLRVEAPGPFSLVQDLGRPGRRAFGVTPSGAMDRFALAAGNLLVGNAENAAGLECALAGPSLVALSSCVLAVTGGDFQPTLNGEPVPGWTSLFLAQGDRLAFAGRRGGARVYIAVAGGIAGERWLGSVATQLLVGRGGLHGRALKAGDELFPAGPVPRPVVAGQVLAEASRPRYAEEPELSAVAGPHARRLDAPSRRSFYRERWAVSRDSDRMGYRLEGAELQIDGPDLVSFGLAMGCVQVPPSGQPIVLMADHQTAGGYPVVAGVVRADLPLLAQLLPGDHLRFREVKVEAAQGEWRKLRAGLEALRR